MAAIILGRGIDKGFVRTLRRCGFFFYDGFWLFFFRLGINNWRSLDFTRFARFAPTDAKALVGRRDDTGLLRLFLDDIFLLFFRFKPLTISRHHPVKLDIG